MRAWSPGRADPPPLGPQPIASYVPQKQTRNPRNHPPPRELRRPPGRGARGRGAGRRGLLGGATGEAGRLRAHLPTRKPGRAAVGEKGRRGARRLGRRRAVESGHAAAVNATRSLRH